MDRHTSTCLSCGKSIKVSYRKLRTFDGSLCKKCGGQMSEPFIDTARIEVTQHEICYGRYYNTYKWIGDKKGLARVQRNMYKAYKSEFPWRTKIVNSNIFSNSYDVARVDNIYFLSFVYHWIKERTFDIYNNIKSRLIMTLMVWGLAYVREGCIPQWKDIFKKAF